MMQNTGEELDILLIFQSKTKKLVNELNQFMRYVSNDEIGNEPTEQLQVMNQLISVLRGDKKLKPFCLNVIKNTLDLYE